MSDKKHIDYWITGSDHDFTAMEHLYQSGDYSWALFVGHLVIEKLLKAYYVQCVDNNVPISHNLLWIAEKTDLTLTDEQKDFLQAMTSFNIKARYDDEEFGLYMKCTKEFAGEYLQKLKEFRLWIRKKLSI